MDSSAHALYLAVIAVLVIVIVYAVGRAIRSQRIMREIETRFGAKPGTRSSVPRPGALRPFDAEGLRRERTFDEYRKEIDGLIERVFELQEFSPQAVRSQLTEACEHALQDGKRLRPIIVMEICRAANANKAPQTSVDPADIALAVEFLHAASLVVDDLPAFDNDEERRGRETVHVKTNPAVAQMAALSLVAAAFQDICRQIDWIRDNCPEFKNVDQIGTRLCHDVSSAIGAMGAAGGQFMDSSLSEDELFRDYGPDAVLDIMQLKTATFFEIAFLGGWLVSGATDGEDLQRAGRHFGTAFQIADDIGDMAQDAARRAAGKPGWNFANQYGEEEARRLIEQHLNAARLILQEKKIYTPLWQEIYSKVWEMTEADPSE